MTQESNRVLEQVLVDLLELHRKASNWVHDDAQLEPTGEVLMGELVSGDLRTIERCLDWVRTCDVAIGARPVKGAGPTNWTLQIDPQAQAALRDEDCQWLEAMHHLLFQGPAPARDSAVWVSLSSIGLPPGLSEDLESS